jgi:hypothetical protein
MPKQRNVNLTLTRVGIAAILLFPAGLALQAAEPAAGPAEVKPAPELAPGIAPGVVPGARPGATPAPLPSGPAPTGEAAPPVSPAEVKGSPDWPCIQRKVMTISPAQVWDGPPLDDVKGWQDDDKIAELTPYLESRRVSVEDAEKAIKAYAESLPAAERDKKLTLLFASVLDKINSDRLFVMGRVEDFQRRQKARADELEREGSKLAALNQEIPAAEQLGPRDSKLTPEQQEYDWNARIFAERQQNLTVACEIPVLIEQRAYEIARLIRAQMSS